MVGAAIAVRRRRAAACRVDADRSPYWYNGPAGLGGSGFVAARARPARGQASRRPGSVDIDGENLPLDAEHLVKVDAGTARVLSSGPDGLRVLCIGSVPGRAYEPPRVELVGGVSRR